MSHDYGRSFGPLFWRYDLTRGVEFLRACGRGLRFYGLVLPWTEWGFGIVRRVPLSPITPKEVPDNG